MVKRFYSVILLALSSEFPRPAVLDLVSVNETHAQTGKVSRRYMIQANNFREKLWSELFTFP